MQRLIDMAARHLPIDPAELRLRNLIRTDEFPYKVASGMVWDRSGFILAVESGRPYSYFGYEVWAAYASGLKSVQDATSIRSLILDAFEQAEATDDPVARENLLTFLICGAGVELAGAIAELSRHGMTPTANIQHRKSIEEVYPPDAFASDAAYNRQVTNEIILGVRILSAPNAEGDFIFERSSQHIAEVATPTFLVPHRREEIRHIQKKIVRLPEPLGLPAGYVEFLDDIVAAAQQFGFDPEKSPGRDEPRLQGLRRNFSYNRYFHGFGVLGLSLGSSVSMVELCRAGGKRLMRAPSSGKPTLPHAAETR